MNDIYSLTSEESDTDSVISTESTSDIFFIYNSFSGIYIQSIHSPHIQSLFAQEIQDNKIKLNTIDKKTDKTIDKKAYVKHTNLDTKELTLSEQIHLKRLHYFTLCNAIRLFIIILCFVWFCFNVYTVFNDYLKYETVVFMEFRSPKYTLPPAISICTESIFDKVPEDIMRTIKVYDVIENSRFHQLFNFETDNVQCLLTFSTIGDLSDQVINCSEIVPVLISIQEGRRCFTYFSDVYGQITELNQTSNGTFQFDFESFPIIKLIIFGESTKGVESESFNKPFQEKTSSFDFVTEIKSTGLLLALHDPTQIHYMHDLPMHTIPPGKYLDSRFIKKIEDFSSNSGCYQYERLQNTSPDYNKLIIQSGFSKNNDNFHLSDYRTRGECFIYCILRLLNRNKCVNIYSILTKEAILKEYLYQNLNNNLFHSHSKDFVRPKQMFCSNLNDSLSEYLSVKKFCMILCPSACSIETYDFDANFITDNFDENITVIEIQWSPDPITYIAHREKFENSEFVGNIGGHAHIWLGISVIHIIRYLISLVRNRHFMPRNNR